MSNTKDVYRPIYENIKADSELEVDKYIKFLAGGALMISLTFIDKILPSQEVDSKWLIIWGLLFLVVALIVNFSSHFLTIRNAKKAIMEIDSSDVNWGNKVLKRNKYISASNIISSILTIFGIVSITLFVIFNINNYGKTNSNTQTQSVKTRAGQESNSSDPSFTYKQTKNK